MLVSSYPSTSAEIQLDWQSLPPLPDPIGVAGAFAGVSGGALIVGGGANFPDGKMPWDGGVKVWHDAVYVLEHPGGKWKSGLKLPRPSGYGVSVTTPEGVVCIGGSDARQHLTNVFTLRWESEKIVVRDLPPLPFPLANSCGALLGSSVYVAGGTKTPDATTALHKFLRLDLGGGGGWHELEPWPGPARMLSVAAAVDGAFFLAGGTDLSRGSNGAPARTYLKDAYRYSPGSGWKRVVDMPNPVVAAPTPAPVIGKHGFLVIGGDDGSLLNFEPKSKHPGFPRRVLAYDAQRDRWSVAGETPASRATLPTAHWNGLDVLMSGEMKPGVRSPEVWAVKTVK